MHDNRTIELWLSKHSQEVLALFLCQIINAERFNSLEQTYWR